VRWESIRLATVAAGALFRCGTTDRPNRLAMPLGIASGHAWIWAQRWANGPSGGRLAVIFRPIQFRRPEFIDDGARRA